LKLTVPSEYFAVETAALMAWDGRSMVRLIQRDVEQGAALLQWLDSSVSLADVPLDEAVAVAGEMLTNTPTTDRTAYFGDARAEATQGCKTWLTRNDALGNFFSIKMLQATQSAVLRVAAHPESMLVNHDLHYANVIRDWDGNWVCIDPKPTTGPPEYAIAPLIWRRYDNPTDSLARLDRFCEIAKLDHGRAFDWLLVRLVAYAFWALESGLTTDPALCRELVDRMTSRG
jgi:streptomycin 6-kinase